MLHLTCRVGRWLQKKKGSADGDTWQSVTSTSRQFGLIIPCHGLVCTRLGQYRSIWTLQLYSTSLSRGHASVPITTCKCQRSGEHAQRWLLAVENYKSQKKKRILEHLKPIDHKDPKNGSFLSGKITKEKSLHYRSMMPRYAIDIAGPRFYTKK